MKIYNVQKTLKAYSLFFLVTLTILSCSKDDDKPSETIVETWVLTSLISENNHDFNNDGTSTNNILQETHCSGNETLVFKSNGTGTQEIENYPLIQYDGTTDTFTTDCLTPSDLNIDAVRPITWTQTNNTRSYTIDGFTYQGTVSGSQLTINLDNTVIATAEIGEIYIEENLTIIYQLQ